MKTKRKSRPIHEASLLKWHMMAFIIVTVGLVWSIFSTLTYPGNANVPFAAWEPFISSRIAWIMVWGLIVLAHMGTSQLRIIRVQQDRDDQLENIVLKPKNDVLCARLDERDDRDEDSWLTHDEVKRLQSRYE
jgi:p-aminobenzoyl-glutamate transporter AbgT